MVVIQGLCRRVGDGKAVAPEGVSSSGAAAPLIHGAMRKAWAAARVTPLWQVTT